MKRESAWVENFFNYQFPLLKSEIRLDKAEEMLIRHRPGKLYKYRQADANGFSVIENGKLWLARSDDVNDPFDCFFEYDLDALLDSHEQKLRETTPEVSDEIVHQIRQSRRGEIEKEHNKHRDFFRKSIKLCSLSTQLDILKMWERYSDNHTGFCIELDCKIADSNIWELLFPIHYSNVGVDLSLYITKVHRERQNVNRSFLRRAALTKSLDWEYEKEWRIIIPGEPEEIGGYCNFMPISCVYLGYEASHDTSDSVESICRQKGIALKKMQKEDETLVVVPYS